jgi:hypothetical protein
VVAALADLRLAVAELLALLEPRAPPVRLAAATGQ